MTADENTVAFDSLCIGAVLDIVEAVRTGQPTSVSQLNRAFVQTGEGALQRSLGLSRSL